MDETKLIEDLRRDEGVVNCAYQDSLGYWTIGVGRLIDKRKGGCISDDEINYLLVNDAKKVEVQLDAKLPWWRQMEEPRQRVLANMTFNLGIDGVLGFHNTLTFMQNKQYKEAADGMRSSKWAKQVGKRAERLADTMETGFDS